jgi:hypothetical protein
MKIIVSKIHPPTAGWKPIFSVFFQESRNPWNYRDIRVVVIFRVFSRPEFFTRDAKLY